MLKAIGCDGYIVRDSDSVWCGKRWCCKLSCCSSSQNEKCTFLQLNSASAHQPPHTDFNTVTGPSSQVWSKLLRGIDKSKTFYNAVCGI